MPTFALRSISAESMDNAALHATTAPEECCGCPNDTHCAQYCRRQYGSAGGYCEGFLDLRCVCV